MKSLVSSDVSNEGIHEGNPPFGDEVPEGDEDHLGSNTLSQFEVARGRPAVVSEHVILEQSIRFLDDGGRLGFVVPTGCSTIKEKAPTVLE